MKILQKPKILILMSRTGGGHFSLAQALHEMLCERYDTEIVDPYPAIFRQYHALLGSGTRHFSWVWKLEYETSNNEQAALRVHTLLTALVQKQLRILIKQIRPQLIITTHPLLTYEAAQAIEQRSASIQLVFQLSELEEVHSTWLTVKTADAYLVPTREIFPLARSRGIDEGRLHLTGFPVRTQFLQDYSKTRSETLTALGLDPALFTVFLQAGAEGGTSLDASVKSILAAGSPTIKRGLTQIVLAIGINKRLAARFTGVDHVGVVPFTRTIAPYMAAADIIMGKAGANFIAEAMMLGKPFAATTFIPGQETPNLAFLERNNLGWVCLEAKAQQKLMTRLVSDPLALAEKVSSVQTYREWNLQANQKISTVIDGLL